MSISNEGCVLCHKKFNKNGNNIASFDCGHRFHLSCILKNAKYYSTSCPICSKVQNTKLKPNLGDDRSIAMASNIQARIRRRQLQPKQQMTWFMKILSTITPFNKTPENLTEYISAGYNLTELQKTGFTPDDCIQENIKWDYIIKKASIAHILQFGLKWKDMVSMGIKPHNLKDFTWSQLKHTLNLNASELLKLNMTLTELGELEYTPHQLNDLGFTWEIFTALGASVETMPSFRMTVDEIKTYFSPTVNQWIQAGFYDKNRLTKAGWDVNDVILVLPRTTDRSSGRQLRLAF